MKISRDLMGMPITIEVFGSPKKTIEKSYKRLEQINQLYSPYISTSQLSKFWSQSQNLSDMSKEFRSIYDECIKYEKLTDGYFSAFFEKRYNPTGYVKGWAIEQVSKKIKKDGFDDYCINLSGDMKFSSSGEKIWRVAIQNPFDKNKSIAVLALKNGAIATSGNYERGEHILNPKKPNVISDIAGVTIVGEDIIKADVLATAIYAMGLSKAKKFLDKEQDYQALIIDKKENIYQTSDYFVLV